MSDFIHNDDEFEGSGGGHVDSLQPSVDLRSSHKKVVEAVGGEFHFDDNNDLDADAAIARMISEEIGEGGVEPEVRPADKVRRERLVGGDGNNLDTSADIEPTLFNPIDRDLDLEKAMEESRLLYEVEGNLHTDPDFEKAIAESIEAQIRHEEEITKAALEAERNKRSTECDLPLRRLKMMFGRKPDLLARVDALFRAYMECATGPYLYLSSEDHLFFGDLMDYLYTLPSKLMGRSILSKDVYERLTKYMVIRDAEITPEDQFFMRSQWAEGMSDEALRQRWAILKSIFE